MAKIKAVLTQDDPLRRLASLNNRDIQALKDELPKLLRKNNTSSSQGDNLQAYYGVIAEYGKKRTLRINDKHRMILGLSFHGLLFG